MSRRHLSLPLNSILNNQLATTPPLCRSTAASSISVSPQSSDLQKRYLRNSSRPNNIPTSRNVFHPLKTPSRHITQPFYHPQQNLRIPPSNLTLPHTTNITTSADQLPSSTLPSPPVLTQPPKRIIVAVTGATGTIYALRLLQLLHSLNIQTHLILSKWALSTLKHELPPPLNAANAFTSLAHTTHSWRDVSAAPASGSFLHSGMIIVPCSMKTLAAIRTGYTSDLISRAADVTLKEGRKLVLVVRETPLSEIHLENMLAVKRAGAMIAPNVPAFYHRPSDLEGVIAQGVGRMADWLGVHTEGAFERWGGFGGCATGDKEGR